MVGAVGMTASTVLSYNLLHITLLYLFPMWISEEGNRALYPLLSVSPLSPSLPSLPRVGQNRVDTIPVLRYDSTQLSKAKIKQRDRLNSMVIKNLTCQMCDLVYGEKTKCD